MTPVVTIPIRRDGGTIQIMQRFSHFHLWLVLAAFVALGAIYIWSIPPLEGSDEFEHFAYVTWLIEERSFPIQGEAGWNSPVRQESGQPPLYYLLASLPARLAGTQPPVIFRPNPYFRYDLNPTIPDNKNTALHYPADTGGGWRGIYMARVVSLLSGAFLIVCVYGLTGTVLPNHSGAPLAAAAFTAFIPQVIFHSSHVSNDMLAAALSTLALWLLARIVRFGGSRTRGFYLGLALGLAALVKVNTLVIGLPVVLGMAWLWFGRGGKISWRDRTYEASSTGTGLVLGFLLSAGWWFIRSWLRYGSFLGLDTHCYQELSTCGPIGLVWPNPLAWRDTFRSFWAAFGLANIRPYDWVYWIFVALIALAALGLALFVVRWGQARHAGRNESDPTTLASDPHLPVLLLLMASALAGNMLLLYVWMQQILATYGRLLYPALGGFIVLLIAGLWELHPKAGRLVWVLPAFLAIAAPFWLIRPAYALPRFLDEPAMNGNVAALGWRYGEIAELTRVMPLARSVAAGELLPVEVCWRTLATPETNYTVYLQAVGPGEAVVADRYTYHGLGSYPSAIWQAGLAFCDTIRVPIPPTLEKTLVYQLSIGLLDDEQDVRLPGTDPAGNQLPPYVAPVRLVAKTAELNEPAPPGDAPIRLGRVDFSSSWQPAQDHPVSLHWYAADAVPVDYTVFLHLRNDAGEIIAQADGPPLDGWYPTSWWTAGEWVADEHLFALPAGVAPGRYQLVAGLYDPATGARLGEEQPLGAITVVEGGTP